MVNCLELFNLALPSGKGEQHHNTDSNVNPTESHSGHRYHITTDLRDVPLINVVTVVFVLLSVRLHLSISVFTECPNLSSNLLEAPDKSGWVT